MDETSGVSPLNHHSDGEPKEIGKGNVKVVNGPLRTNYKDLPTRYALAEKQVWSKLPLWKQKVIVDCKATGFEKDRVYDEYVKEIISLAECSNTKFDESLPDVPFSGKKVKLNELLENPS